MKNAKANYKETWPFGKIFKQIAKSEGPLVKYLSKLQKDKNFWDITKFWFELSLKHGKQLHVFESLTMLPSQREIQYDKI